MVSDPGVPGRRLGPDRTAGRRHHACKAQRRLLDLGIAAVLLALSVRSAILLDAYSIGYLATAFACFALAGLKEE